MSAATPPNPADAVAAAAWQRLFAATEILTRFAQLAWVAGFLAFWLAPRFPVCAALLGASLLPGLAAIYYGFRVHLDAGLLLLLEPVQPVAPAQFAPGMDLFRAQLAGRAPIGGPLAARYAGILGLWRRCIAALAGQIGCLVLAAACAMFANAI